MEEAVIVDTVRTALAKSHRGALNATRSDEMAAHCIKQLLVRLPDVDPSEIDDVILGCGYPEGSQGRNVARIAALRAGLGVQVPGATITRFCASGLQSIAQAAHRVMLGESRVTIAGGVENISGMGDARRDPNPWIEEHYPGAYMVMGDTAEVVAKRYKIRREDQDSYACESQSRTAHAERQGYLRDEICPMHVVRKLYDSAGNVTGSESIVLEKDECARPGTTLEGLAKLGPCFDTKSGEGTVTAGNACQLADGAAATLVMSRREAKSLGFGPLVAFRGLAVAGCSPEEMGIGPVFAVPKLLSRFKLSVSDVGLWELNEAFAVQVVYCRDCLGIPAERLNVNGGSIALGHPFGMTGTRMVGALMREMRRREARFGVVTMCVGGGQGAAALFELCD